MKFLGISCLFLSVGLKFVSGNFLKRQLIDFEVQDDNYVMQNTSNDCKTAAEKSITCFRKIESEINAKGEFFGNLDFENLCDPTNEKGSAEKCKSILNQGLDAVCKVFEINECKDFIADNTAVNLIKSGKCVSSDYDVTLLEKVVGIKSAYLMVCKKSDSGKLCPLGQYATTNAIDFAFSNFKYVEKYENDEYGAKATNEFEGTLELFNDALTVLPVFNDLNNILIDSCSDASCNKNILALDNIILEAKKAFETSQEIKLSEKYPKIIEMYDSYLDNYRNKNCNMVGFNSGAGTLKKITYSFVGMLVASVLLLL